jgi:hypothetical protein
MKSQLFGVEIEMTGLTRRKCAEVVAEHFDTTASNYGGSYDEFRVKDDQHRTWKIMSDGSITSEVKGQDTYFRSHQHEYKVELVTPILTYDDIPKLQEIVRKIRAANGMTNLSCGMHVHVNAAPFDAKTLRNLVNIFNSKEDLLYKALKVPRSRENRFCQKTNQEFLQKMQQSRPQTMDKIKDLWYNGADGSHLHYHNSRYHCLNLHSVFSKGTVEVRAANSTLHAGKIRSIITLCLAMTYKALTQSKASPRPTQSTNEKYTFRTFLLNLGLIGDEYKNIRKHLLENLEGNIAWKNPEDALRQREELKAKREAEKALKSEQKQSPSEEQSNEQTTAVAEQEPEIEEEMCMSM